MKHSIMFKEVNFFGLELMVYSRAKFICCDADGGVYSFDDKPKADLKQNLWLGTLNTNWVAEVDLEGMDWRETLVEIK